MLKTREVCTEKLHAAKMACAGQLSAITRGHGSVKTLLDNVENAAMVRERFFQYDKSWNELVDSHNSFMLLVKDESEDHVNYFHQYNQLTQERAVFNETVDYLL